MNNKILNTLTYKQKVTFLIDVKGYSEEDFENLGEIGIDNILLDNKYIEDLYNFTK